jgi:hypothetical protein
MNKDDTGVLGCGAGQHGGFDTFLKFLSINASLNEQGCWCPRLWSWTAWRL